AGPGDTVETFRARHVTGLRVAQFSLKSDAPWLTAPALVAAAARETEIPLIYSAPALAAPGVYVGTVTAWNPSDTLAGPLFVLVNTISVPFDLAARPLYDVERALGPAKVQRYFLRVARPGATLRVAVTVPDSAQQRVSVRLTQALIGAERGFEVTGRGAPAESIGVQVPEWAARAVIDVQMPREQWDEFTDFGVTDFDSAGQQVGQGAMNYAFGRHSFEVAPGLRKAPVTIELFP